MTQVRNYKDLIVWQKSMQVVVAIYALTKNLPHSEIYGLNSQMRRSAVSLPSNIAEGSRRGSRKEYRHFLRIAFGSGAELETQLILAQQLFGLVDGKLNDLLDEVMKMLNRMISTLDSRQLT